MTTEDKLTPKAAALAALRDAIGEVGRKEGARLIVLGALLTDALVKLDAVEELKGKRKKPKTAKESAP